MTEAIQTRADKTQQQLRQFFKASVWQDPDPNSALLWRLWVRFVRVSFIMIRELATGELNLRAMSLVYTTLLSLVPLIAVTFSVLKAFGVHNQMEPILLNLFEPLGEKGPEITRKIIGFVQNIKVGVLGSVGLGMLFYTIVALIQKVESAFNYVWRVKRARSLSRRFTDYLSVVMIGPVLVFSALGLSAAVLDHEIVQHLREIEPFGTLLLWLTKMLPFLMIILAFTFLYKFIPNTTVKTVPAILGATLAGILWILVGTLFASFVGSSSNYTAIYSSFAILFFFMIWLYLAWFILLIGSQLAYYLQHPKVVQLTRQPMVLSPRQREQEGLWVMTVIARRFCNHLPPLTIQEIEKQTGLTSDVVHDLLFAFESAGLLAEVAGDEVRYIPAQDVAIIKVVSVLHCLRTTEESYTFVPGNTVDRSVTTLLQKISDAQAEVIGKLTLRELAMDQHVND